MTTRRIRVIPTLLISRERGGLVKGVGFKKHVYVGDPINAVKVYNDKEVDEIAILDIDASRKQAGPDFSWVEEICSEAFMPLAYGGGVTRVDQVVELLRRGVEKVIVNTSAAQSPQLLTAASKLAGSQSIVAAIDVKQVFLRGQRAMILSGTKDAGHEPLALAKRCEDAGAGEILLTSIEREGSRSGYDLALVRTISHSVKIPVIANGGAGTIEDFSRAVRAGASAVAAGTMFTFVGSKRGVLISYPAPEELESFFASVAS